MPASTLPRAFVPDGCRFGAPADGPPLDHVERVVSVAGEDHVGFGTDPTVDGSSDAHGIGSRFGPEVVGDYDRRVGARPGGNRDARAPLREFAGGNLRRVIERDWRE